MFHTFSLLSKRHFYRNFSFTEGVDIEVKDLNSKTNFRIPVAQLEVQCSE